MLRLKELRKSRKLSQKELANQLGFAQNALSQYETGMHQPDNVTLIKIADFFEVSVDYLLGKSEKNPLTMRRMMLTTNFSMTLGRFPLKVKQKPKNTLRC